MNLERATKEGNSPVSERIILTTMTTSLDLSIGGKYYWTRVIQ